MVVIRQGDTVLTAIAVRTSCAGAVTTMRIAPVTLSLVAMRSHYSETSQIPLRVSMVCFF